MPETTAPTPFPLPLRAQATGTDARAERLIRQIRGEVEELRAALDEVTGAQGEMMTVDLAAVVADPGAAAALPAPVLVRAIISAAKEIERLQAQVAEQARAMTELVSTVHELREEQSFRRGRLETLEEVIAALHANLQDFRTARDYGRGPMVNGNGAQAAIAAAEAAIAAYDVPHDD